MLKDFVIIIIFAICFSLAQSLETGRNFEYLSILLPVGELTISVGIGYLMGKALALILSLGMHANFKAGAILVLGYFAYYINGINYMPVPF